MLVENFDIHEIIREALDDEDLVLEQILSGKRDADKIKNGGSIKNEPLCRTKDKKSGKEKKKAKDNLDNEKKQTSSKKRKPNEDDVVYVADLSPEIKDILNTGREGYPAYIFCDRRQHMLFHTLCCLGVTLKCKRVCEYYKFGMELKNELGIKRRKIYYRDGETIVEDEE